MHDVQVSLLLAVFSEGATHMCFLAVTISSLRTSTVLTREVAYSFNRFIDRISAVSIFFSWVGVYQHQHTRH
jgi:hypothetical protein